MDSRLFLLRFVNEQLATDSLGGWNRVEKASRRSAKFNLIKNKSNRVMLACEREQTQARDKQGAYPNRWAYRPRPQSMNSYLKTSMMLKNKHMWP